MSGRALRVGGILALLAWSLSSVPDRVQAQREAVATLAAERGAAAAGGALLAALEDLSRHGEAVSRDVWRLSRTDLASAAPRGDLPYGELVASVRSARARRAVGQVPTGSAGAVLVEVEGDLYLVVGSAPQAAPVRANEVAQELAAAMDEARAAAAEARMVADQAARAIEQAAAGLESLGVTVRVERRVDLHADIGDRAPSVATTDPTVVPPAPGAPPPAPMDAPTLPDAPEPPDAPDPPDPPEAQAAPPTVLSPGPDGSWRVVSPDIVIPPLPVLGVEIPELRIPGLDVHVLSPEAFPAFAPPLPEAASDSVLVAWWPPLQARVEQAAGVPLQVGGEPPHAHTILPGHRLSGLPVWSLPTPDTEAAFDLFDYGSLVWMGLLAALLGREYWSWRREDARERERQGARDSILARLSHELRTPAAAVRTLMDTLEHPGTSEAERAQFLGLARTEAERLSAGIDRLLAAARGNTEIAIDPIPLDLHEWAEGVRQRWLARLPELEVRGEAPCLALADPDRLDEAIDALLDNARKYGGPHVVLTVLPGRVSVEDDGEGVPVKDRARVLEKFERIEGRVNDPGGHGLGLWAAGEVARAHGGRLRLEGPNCFVLTLPGSP